MTSSSLEARVAHVEGIVGQLDARLARLEARLDEAVAQLRGEIGLLKGELVDVRREMRSNFYWVVGIMLGTMLPMWVTIMLAIFLKG